MNTPARFLPVVILALAVSFAHAEEKNGISVSVSKTTIEKNDTRGSGYYSDRINRTQGLKAVIRNMSFKEMPEGEVIWSILVRKYYSTTVEISTGSEKLRALKPAEATDMVIGSAEVSGYNYSGSTEKDKIEWQVIVKQDGKELIKTQSTSSFDALAKRAIKVTPSAKPAGN